MSEKEPREMGWLAGRQNLDKDARIKLCAQQLEQVPRHLRALMRYDAAGLLDQLLPVSERAVKLLAAYAHAVPAEHSFPE